MNRSLDLDLKISFTLDDDSSSICIGWSVDPNIPMRLALEILTSDKDKSLSKLRPTLNELSGSSCVGSGH